nr:MAG TPA: hypothetical protein [Caudoviricetes sp.]
MIDYIAALRRRLMLECACVTSRGGREGIYDYTQKKFAFYSINRAGGSLSEANVSRIYDTGYFWADESGEEFIAKDIIEVDGCFNALKFCIDNMNEPITPEYVEEIQQKLYPGTPAYMTEGLRALIIGNNKPEQLRDIANFHIQYVQHGGDSRTVSLISYVQCINASLTPFIIHPENQALYERYMRVDTVKFCHLLHVEQNRYREETEPLVMDWET